jgi:hypothetical protein
MNYTETWNTGHFSALEYPHAMTRILLQPLERAN